MEKAAFLEFFAGGGLARIGLGKSWECVFSNDISEKKAFSYKANFGAESNLVVGDVSKISIPILEKVKMAWASFPCQDLSLAGNGKGINGARSGAFWGFWSKIQELISSGNQPPIIAIENVVGLLSTNQGKDFSVLLKTIIKEGYKVGSFIIDAVNFVPQSRPRLFIVAVKDSEIVDKSLISIGPQSHIHPISILNRVDSLPPEVKEKWIWWSLPQFPKRKKDLIDLIDKNESTWHSSYQTQRILSLMSKVNKDKVNQAKASGKRIIGALYRRTRIVEGQRTQRWEVRFDGISGCLRTPAGGSSRQVIMEVQGKKIRTRLISKLELSKLMGLKSNYLLPTSYNDAYHLLGDAVVVPVVNFISENLLLKIASIEADSLAKVA